MSEGGQAKVDAFKGQCQVSDLLIRCDEHASVQRTEQLGGCDLCICSNFYSLYLHEDTFT